MYVITHFLSILYIQDGATPLYMASQDGHTTTVDVLLRNGADPNIATNVSVVYTCIYVSSKQWSY